MFKNIHFGDDQYSDYYKEQELEMQKEENEKMDKITRIEAACEQIIKKLNRIQEDISTIETNINCYDKSNKEKLMEICNIVEDINDNMIKRD